MKPCPECDTTTADHPSSCQVGADIYESQQADLGVPGYVMEREPDDSLSGRSQRDATVVGDVTEAMFFSNRIRNGMLAEIRRNRLRHIEAEAAKGRHVTFSPAFLDDFPYKVPL